MCVLAVRDLKNYDIILLDTSVLMRRKGLTKFINNVYNVLAIYRQKITVPTVVWLELTRHLNSNDQSLSSAASYAIQTINSNRAIFQIEEKDIDYSEVDTAFADKVLLSSLIINKPDHKQLLITNDDNLASDARSLNYQKSCYGYSIDTCRLSKAGNLVGFGLGHYDVSVEPFEESEKIDKQNYEDNVLNVNDNRSVDQVANEGVISKEIGEPDTSCSKQVEKNDSLKKIGIIGLTTYAVCSTVITGIVLFKTYGKRSN